MNLAALKLLLSGLPWRWVGLVALCVGLWGHGYITAGNACSKAQKLAEAAQIKAQKERLENDIRTMRTIDRNIESAEAGRNQLASDYRNRLRDLATAIVPADRLGTPSDSNRAHDSAASRDSDANARKELAECQAAGTALADAVAELRSIALTAAKQVGGIATEIQPR